MNYQGTLGHVTMRDGATRAIRAQVISGSLEPNRLYSIGEIAAELGTSPTPVREALLDLSHQGLVEMVRNRGFRVRTIEHKDMRELVELRRLLEVPIMVALADRDPRPDTAPSRRIAEAAIDSAQASEIVEFLNQDRDFHLGLIALHGNARLTETVSNLRDQTRLFGIAHLEGSSLRRSAQEHLEILDRIDSGDRKGVRRVMERHLGHILGEWGGVPDDAR